MHVAACWREFECNQLTSEDRLWQCGDEGGQPLEKQILIKVIISIIIRTPAQEYSSTPKREKRLEQVREKELH